MPSRKAKQNTPSGVGAWLKAKDFRDNRLWHLFKGKMVTNVNGEYLTKKEFDEKFPVPKPVTFYIAKDNYDKTKDYLK